MPPETGSAKEPAIMELADKVLSLATNLDEQMTGFLEGCRPTDSAEKSPQPDLTTLDALSESLKSTAKRIESATSRFHQITNKIM